MIFIICDRLVLGPPESKKHCMEKDKNYNGKDIGMYWTLDSNCYMIIIVRMVFVEYWKQKFTNTNGLDKM